MILKVVSDLHSGVEALRSEIEPSDTLLLLGDLVNIIDYTAMDGILVDIFGEEAVQQVVALRTQGRFEEARATMAARRTGREEEIGGQFQRLLKKEYAAVAEALICATFLILGNVDTPWLLEEVLTPNVTYADGKVFEFGGVRIGFVGGGLPTPLHVPGEIPEEEYNGKLDGLGEVDILCSHIPPDVPELTYDILARRHERGSSRLLEYVRDVQPRYLFFGHIHQPLVSSVHVGRTHLINTGYFRRTERAFRLAI